MTETLDTPEGGSKKLSVFLIVLLILTSLNIAYSLFSAATNLGSQAELEDFQTELISSLERSGTDLENLPTGFAEAIDEFIPDLVAGFKNHNLFSLAYYLVLILPVYLMFKRMRVGLYVYTILQIVGTFDFLYFYRANIITLSITVLFALGTIIFLILYWMNRKSLE